MTDKIFFCIVLSYIKMNFILFKSPNIRKNIKHIESIVISTSSFLVNEALRRKLKLYFAYVATFPFYYLLHIHHQSTLHSFPKQLDK